jgi:hypothetical protein
MNILTQFIYRQEGNKMTGTLVFFFFLWILALGFRAVRGADDFDVFLQAGKGIVNGRNIYGPPYYNQLKFYYSPLFALLLAPLAYIPLIWAKLLWFCLNYLLLLRSVYILKTCIRMNFKGSIYIVALLCLCSGKIIMYNFLANQLTIFVLWCLLESFRLYRNKQPVWAIVLFCVGLNFKILPIAVLPFYLLVRPVQYKLLFPLVCILLLLLPATMLGWDTNLALLRHWWGNINPADHAHVLQVSEQGFLDIDSLLTRYLSSATVVNEASINIAELGYQGVLIMVNVCRLVLLALTIFVTRRIGDIPGVHTDLAAIVPFIALIPILLPHQRDYSFLLLMPMLMVLLKLLRQLGKKRWMIVFACLVVLSGMLAWSTLLGSRVVDLFYAYRLISIGMSGFLLMYLFILSRFSPNNILISSQDVQK